MNKKISAVVTLVGLILIMCAMAVLFHNKKEDNLAQKSSNTVLSSLKEKIEEKITMYIFRHGKRFKPDNSRPQLQRPLWQNKPT